MNFSKTLDQISMWILSKQNDMLAEWIESGRSLADAIPRYEFEALDGGICVRVWIDDRRETEVSGEL